MADSALPPYQPSHSADGRWIAVTATVCLLLVHGGLTVQVFGPDRPWGRLFDDQPITSGQHPLHLYHGALGTAAWQHVGSGGRYDAAFYAGYPVTAVFDSDSRPAEWFQAVGGGGIRPDAYKVGLALCWWLLPFGYWAAGRVLGLGPGPCAVAAGIAVALAWSDPSRRLFELGDLVIVLVAVFAALHLSFLARCHTRSSAWWWLGILVTALAGWSLQPLLWCGFTLFTLGCVFGVGQRQGLAWHLGLLACHSAALGLTFPVWHDWFHYWWIRLPLRGGVSVAAGPDGAAWGDVPIERAIFLLLVVSGVAGGLKRLTDDRRCPTAWLAVASGTVLLLAAAGAVRDGWLPVSGSRLVATGLWLAVVPAANTTCRATRWLLTDTGRSYVGVIVGGGLFLLVAGVLARRPTAWELPTWGPRPLDFGLPADVKALEEVLGTATTRDARILWEDLPARTDRGWAVLLPQRLGRAFIGGLDPDRVLEHAAIGLHDGHLAGRPLSGWTDAELEGYCRRYNVGWVVCQTPATRGRLARWPSATAVTLPDAADGWHVYRLRRPFTYVLKGQARDFDADRRRVTLADVVPENGEVVISLHYQAGWRVRPSWVRVERELDPYDAIPLMRLCVPGPVSRITLTWERP